MSVIRRLAGGTVQRVEKHKRNCWGNLYYTALQPFQYYLGLFKANKTKNCLE